MGSPKRSRLRPWESSRPPLLSRARKKLQVFGRKTGKVKDFVSAEPVLSPDHETSQGSPPLLARNLVILNASLAAIIGLHLPFQGPRLPVWIHQAGQPRRHPHTLLLPWCIRQSSAPPGWPPQFNKVKGAPSDRLVQTLSSRLGGKEANERIGHTK